MQQFVNEDDVSFSSGNRRSRSFVCLVVLSVAVVILLTTSVVFVVLYALAADRPSTIPTTSTNATTKRNVLTPQSTERPSHKPYTTPTTTPKPGEQKWCGTRTCLLAAIGKAEINFNLTPCCVYPGSRYTEKCCIAIELSGTKFT